MNYIIFFSLVSLIHKEFSCTKTLLKFNQQNKTKKQKRKWKEISTHFLHISPRALSTFNFFSNAHNSIASNKYVRSSYIINFSLLVKRNYKIIDVPLIISSLQLNYRKIINLHKFSLIISSEHQQRFI